MSVETGLGLHTQFVQAERNLAAVADNSVLGSPAAADTAESDIAAEHSWVAGGRRSPELAARCFHRRSPG